MIIANVHPSAKDGLPPEEMARRRARRAAYASPGTEFVDYYVVGNNIFDKAFSLQHATDVVTLAVERIVEAAAGNPDVILVSGGIEPGVQAAQQRVRHVPIVATGLSTYQAAQQLGGQLGHKLGILVYEESIIAPIRAQAVLHHADWMILDIRSIDVPLNELYARRPEVRRRVVEVAGGLVADGATMIFAQGLSMVPASMSPEELAAAVGVPVLDGELIGLRTAEMVGRLHLLRQPVST